MSMTKYEKSLEAQKERAYRQLNISTLKEQLDRAKNVLAVIPRDGWQTQQERQTVQAEIRRLSEFLEDEKRAYKATFEDEETANIAVEKLSLNN